MFWVANLLMDKAPTVLAMHFVPTEAEAVTLGVEMAQEQGSEEDEATIRKELEVDGRYIPTKYSEWSVCMGEVNA